MSIIWTVYYKTKSTRVERHKDFTSLKKAAEFFYKAAVAGGARSDPFISSNAMYSSFAMKDLPWYYFRHENAGTAVEYITKNIQANMR